jgi:hypothetical protein
MRDKSAASPWQRSEREGKTWDDAASVRSGIPRRSAASVQSGGYAASTSASVWGGGHDVLAVQSLHEGVLRRALARIRDAARKAPPPAGPCSTALRSLVENPMTVLVLTLFLLAYLVVLAWTGPQPDSEEDRRLLAGVSIAGLIVWGVELKLKLVGYGAKLLLLDGWRFLQLVCYVSLLAEACLGFRGVALVYLRCFQLVHDIDAILVLLPTRDASWRVWEMTVRTMGSARRMVNSIFLTFTAMAPIICMITVFVVLLALLGHSFFGDTKRDNLRNRCVIAMPNRAEGLAPSWQGRETGEVGRADFSTVMHTKDGSLVETVPWARADQISLQDSPTFVQPLLAVVMTTEKLKPKKSR